MLFRSRSPELNAVVGGAISSDHLYLLNPLHSDAGAVDFTTADLPAMVERIRENFIYKLLIHYPRRRFVHLSFPDSSGEYEIFKEK